ncbi:3-ketosteroid-9-alpha-hydroxylase subunit A [Hoyosella sp. YIM 151337]|uniref:3-ketosteroid-9-alpha-hydroxylase subunit A n=1 Tax=Hoyosella sp. YIM 151337 TaxID=2992742 RepID=UPI002236077E|nr:3-ketosteroid-9-alpha-hydroxylase subunit A [Hoyosella sp. YIM 151337]MCW4353368.1 3-ketosteroid-9-alpha-hydroxylase subunit A [Hoyosella sp. YIM 151337]
MTAYRTIDAGTMPARYARGWHCIGLAESFKDGEPHAIKAFGTKLVVFQSEDGKINVLDGYCRHMGGDLTEGTIKGNEIACPFHDWRWGGDGKCKSIPYAKRVPLRARTRSWVTCEQNKQLFIWHDPEGHPPPEDVAIPRLDAAFSDEWSDWTWNTVPIDGANCRELIDNVVDMAHFYYVHFAFPTYFKNVFEGHMATQYMHSHGRPDMMANTKYENVDSHLRSEATYFGPAWMVNYLYNDYSGFKVDVILINCHYPITENSFMLQYGVIAKKVDGLTDEQNAKLAKSMARNFGEGFLQDVAIWKTKARVDNPLLCEEDGPVYQLRRWYEQFYVDVADVTDDMTQRFEFEVDTTKANQVWEAEVAENLARKKAESGV